MTTDKLDNNTLTNHGRMLNAEKSKEQLEKEEEERISKYIDGCTRNVINNILGMIQEGVDLIVVLDGMTPPIKKDTADRRISERNEATEYLKKDDQQQSDANDRGDGAEEFAAAPLPTFEDEDFGSDSQCSLQNIPSNLASPSTSTSKGSSDSKSAFQFVKTDGEVKKR